MNLLQEMKMPLSLATLLELAFHLPHARAMGDRPLAFAVEHFLDDLTVDSQTCGYW